MDGGFLLWREDDGEATTALRRSMARGFGLLFLALSVLCLPGTWLQADSTARITAGLSAALFLLAALRAARGAVDGADLVLSAVATVLAGVTPDLTGSTSSFTAATAYSIWVIVAAANLRTRVAYVVLVLATVVFLGLAWIGPALAVANAFDTAVFSAGMGVAAVGFLQVLTRSKREQDDLTDAVTALEIAAAMRQLEQASSDTVRRVLHDEVLSALRAVAELPPERRDEVVAAAQTAALAVRQQLVEP